MHMISKYSIGSRYLLVMLHVEYLETEESTRAEPVLHETSLAIFHGALTYCTLRTAIED